jgi:hypothetical protein
LNLWRGVATAGYSLEDELPVFVLIFALPTAVACFALRKRRAL